MNNFRRNSTKVLPSLQTPNKNNPQSVDKNGNIKNVKQIQQKLSLHDNQITRTQKTIVTLTTQFKNIKEQLLRQQQINSDNEKLYQASVNQNSKLNKKVKQLKVTIASMDFAIKQRDKQMQNLKRQSVALKQSKQAQLKLIIDRKVIQNETLSKLVEDLKKEILLSKKSNSKYNEDNHTQQLQNKQKQIKNLNSEVQRMEKIIKSHEKQIYKMKDDQTKFLNVVKQHSKCEHNFSQVKKTNQILLQRIKGSQKQKTLLQQKIRAFQQKCKHLQEQQGKGFQKIKVQLTQTTNKLQKQRKINQNHVRQIEKLKDHVQKLNVVETSLQRFSKKKQNLKSSSAKLKQSIICDYCKKVFNQPVTNIPCGHSFCLQCKKGYQKECKKCITSGSMVKREAVYRNQLMDEVLEAYSVLNQIIRIFE